MKTDVSSGHEIDKQSNDVSETDANHESSKKLNLFVQAPLSKMGFRHKSKQKT